MSPLTPDHEAAVLEPTPARATGSEFVSRYIAPLMATTTVLEALELASRELRAATGALRAGFVMVDAEGKSLLLAPAVDDAEERLEWPLPARRGTDLGRRLKNLRDPTLFPLEEVAESLPAEWRLPEAVFLHLWPVPNARGASAHLVLLLAEEPVHLNPGETEWELFHHLLRLTLERNALQVEVVCQKEFNSALLESSQCLFLELHADGRIAWCNALCRETTGFSLEELFDRPLWSALLIAEEVTQVQEAFQRARNAGEPVKFTSFILTKQGERRRISWSFQVSARSADSAPLLLGSGIDLELRESTAETAEGAGPSADSANPGRTAAEAAHAEKSHERRRHPRREFPFVQLLAPVVNGRKPNPCDFRSVQCHDISAEGFSFVLNHPPSFREMVVSLGAPPNQIRMYAEIVHVTRQQRRGRDVWQVGCRYVRRAT